MTLADFRAYLWMALSDGIAPRELNGTETALANRLAEEKYRTWDWIYGRSPAFTFTRTISGIEISYTARHGRITAATIDAKAVPALTNVPLRPDEIHTALSANGYGSIPADALFS